MIKTLYQKHQEEFNGNQLKTPQEYLGISPNQNHQLSE
jgi:hypothetical protein